MERWRWVCRWRVLAANGEAQKIPNSSGLISDPGYQYHNET